MPNYEFNGLADEIYNHLKKSVSAEIERKRKIKESEMPLFEEGLEKDFYIIKKESVLQATSPEYRRFLKEAGYMDLEAGNGLAVAKSVLRINQDVRDAAAKNNVAIAGNDGDYLVNINQTDGRNIIEAMGCKLLTAGLMYRVFILYIRELVQQGNQEAQATLTEMTNTKAEWLEDLVLDKNRLRLGTKEIALALAQEDGRFDRAGINEFGYPDAVKNTGEFYYWYPRCKERAAIRDGSAGLGLLLLLRPSDANDDLGVRRAKIV